MAKLGFSVDDFRVFRIEDFSARMSEIYARIRPRLVRLGDQLAPELGRRLHMEFFPHIAKHAQGSVNPPAETWAAFGPSRTAYKRFGYLALCVSAIGIHARAIVKSEAERRLEMADLLVERSSDLQKAMRGTGIAHYENWGFNGLPKEVAANDQFFTELGDSLRRKTGGIDVGFGWPVSRAVRIDRAELLDAFLELEPLYRIVRSVV